MKTLILIAVLTWLPNIGNASELIPFGDKIGNGGGLWACKVNGRIVNAELVDLFEARAEFQFRIPRGEHDSPEEIYRQIQIDMSKDLAWLREKLQFFFDYVDRHRSLADGVLVPVDDSLYRLVPKPEDCSGGQWEYKQFANFTPNGKIIIEKGLWESDKISNQDKAALLLHEAVYYWLRHRYQEQHSTRARYIVGILMSDLDAAGKRNELVKALDGLNPPVEVPLPGDGVIDAKGFFLELMNSSNTNGILHKADADYGSNVSTTNMGVPCKIDPNSPDSSTDILCILEQEELDLFFLPQTLRVHVPANMCTYLSQSNYYFYANKPGIGPSRVAYEVHDGSIVDKENSKNGVPQCAFDYSETKGRNCCVGNYTLEVVTRMSNGEVSEVTTTNNNWGGSVSQCLSGPATSASWPRTSEGIPLPSFKFIEGKGLNSAFTIAPAIDQSNGRHSISSNVWAANFYNPIDHQSYKPMALRKPDTIFGAPEPQDTYEWTCLDRAEEVRARIRLMIRDWNTSPITEGGNPDLFSDDPENPLNDRFDWRDFLDSFPGFQL